MDTSSPNQNNDVFIDFSSEDTRYSLVSHLSVALRRNCISVFVGEDCIRAAVTPNTDEFQLPDAVQSAIERAQIFVVVFSENYAFSPLCLETLVKFLQRPKHGLVKVIPIFYGSVTPSMVEQQTESFGDAFSELREMFSGEERILRWRNGLVEAAKIKGHESSNQPIDSKLVEEVVADVCEKLYPFGINLRLLELENLLCQKSHDIYRLGIWGMPGIGKSIVAQAVVNQMSHDFENLCFIQDFHVNFQEKGLYRLRKEHSFEILRGKTVLVVLDDVRNPMEAESFLKGYDYFGPASLIIITSRDKQVLHLCQVEGFYEVPALNKKQALQLFNRFAFSEKELSDSLVEVSEKVVEYTNGNPTALCSYGTELNGRKNREEMEAGFEKIKRCPPREIMELFKSSFDALNDNERNIFLDIACFFKGEELDQVMPILDACGFFPHVGIDRLIKRSLLTKSNNNKVEMHNLIQDFARAIVNGEENQITRRSRLWDPSSIKLLLEENEPKGTEVIEGIFLDTTNLNLAVNPKAFENMYNLRLLKIYSSSSETPQELHHPDEVDSLPNELDSLPYELRLLHWENYPFRSFPKKSFNPSNLVELNMPYSQLRRLWGEDKSLTKLKRVNLSHSQHLVEVDELAKACFVEKIDLQGCTSLKSIPDTDCLKILQHLNLSGCISITRTEITKKIKGLDTEGGLKEAESDSLVFLMLGKLEPEDNSESESPTQK